MNISDYKTLYPESTPFIVACQLGHIDNVVTMIKNNNKDFINQMGYDTHVMYNVTGLMTATEHGRLNVVDTLLEYEADPNIVDDNGQSALTYALIYQKMNVLERLIVKTDILIINHKDLTFKTNLDRVFSNLEYYGIETKDLVQKHGGKSNFYKADGTFVNEGNGDVNTNSRALIVRSTDIKVVHNEILTLGIHFINYPNKTNKHTLLDDLYFYNQNEQIIKFVRECGGKCNFHDEDGNEVERGPNNSLIGDLNQGPIPILLRGSRREQINEVLNRYWPENINKILYNDNNLFDLVCMYGYNKPIVLSLLYSRGGRGTEFDKDGNRKEKHGFANIIYFYYEEREIIRTSDDLDKVKQNILILKNINQLNNREEPLEKTILDEVYDSLLWCKRVKSRSMYQSEIRKMEKDIEMINQKIVLLKQYGAKATNYDEHGEFKYHQGDFFESSNTTSDNNLPHILRF